MKVRYACVNERCERYGKRTDRDTLSNEELTCRKCGGRLIRPKKPQTLLARKMDEQFKYLTEKG